MSGSPDVQGALPASLASIEEVALLEVDDTQAFQEALSGVMKNDLPGFLIRSAGLGEEAIADNNDLSALVQATLGSMGYIFRWGFGTRVSTSRSELPIGNLHIDKEDGGSVQDVNVHTTILGGGKVLLAESGPSVQQRLKPPVTPERAAQELRQNDFLLSGRTDPRMILPTLRTAVLQAGDHIIFPLANDKGPLWHRFDTAASQRTVDVRVLERDEPAEAHERETAQRRLRRRAKASRANSSLAVIVEAEGEVELLGAQ